MVQLKCPKIIHPFVVHCRASFSLCAGKGESCRSSDLLMWLVKKVKMSSKKIGLLCRFQMVQNSQGLLRVVKPLSCIDFSALHSFYLYLNEWCNSVERAASLSNCILGPVYLGWHHGHVRTRNMWNFIVAPLQSEYSLMCLDGLWFESNKWICSPRVISTWT